VFILTKDGWVELGCDCCCNNSTTTTWGDILWAI
jgi:hypothetical protein